MTRPVIWVTPDAEHTDLKRELAQDGTKIADLDRRAIVDYITALAQALIDEDANFRTEHDIKFRAVHLRGLTQLDMVDMGMQAFSSLRRY